MTRGNPIRILALVSCLSCDPGQPTRPGTAINPQPATSGVTRPDILLILADDQRYDLMTYLPLTTARMATAVQFSNAFVTTAQCCPSRSSILTGLYAHNHGVLQSGPPNGGAAKFDPNQTVAVWLRQAGYRTSLIGKYLNGYDQLAPVVPGGWSDWHAFFGDVAYYNYKMSDNGITHKFGAAASAYSTTVIRNKAFATIKGTPKATPLFLYFAPSTPHAPAKPATGDVGKFNALPPWRPASYDEADVSDKPAWIQSLPPISATRSAGSDAFHEAEIESLQALDRAVAAILDTLARVGRLANTYVIYTSDNGLSWGEHRWLDDKGCNYEECVRVPLWIMGPGITPARRDELVANIDLAPTIMEWAGVAVPVPVNGQSLVPLLNGGSAWRSDLLLEWLGNAAIERNARTLRTARYAYTEYDNGDRELYDLVADPLQLDNVVNDTLDAAIVADLQARLLQLIMQ